MLELFFKSALFIAGCVATPVIVLMLITGFKKNMILAKKAGRLSAKHDVANVEAPKEAASKDAVIPGQFTREQIMSADAKTAVAMVQHMRLRQKALRELEALERAANGSAQSSSKRGSRPTQQADQRAVQTPEPNKPEPAQAKPVVTNVSKLNPDSPPWEIDEQQATPS